MMGANRERKQNGSRAELSAHEYADNDNGNFKDCADDSGRFPGDAHEPRHQTVSWS